MAGAAALAVALAACSSSTPTSASTTTTSSTTSTTAGIGAAPTSSSTTSTTASAGPGTTTTTTPPETSSGGPIVITSPKPGATLVSPATIGGKATTGAFQLQLTDGQGNVLASQTVQPGAGGAFSLTLRFATAHPGPGTLVAFTTTSSGARANLTQVPVQLGD